VYLLYTISAKVQYHLHIKVATVTVAAWTDRFVRSHVLHYSLSSQHKNHLTNSTVIFTRTLDWRETGCVGAIITVWKNRNRHWSFRTALQQAMAWALLIRSISVITTVSGKWRINQWYYSYENILVLVSFHSSHNAKTTVINNL